VNSQELEFRPATARDAPRIAELVVEGFSTYTAFAPEGWSPTSLEDEIAYVEATLAHASAWCRVAEDGSGLAGHCGWLAASEARVVSDEPGLVHFWQLFVRRDRWGSGLAATLQAAAIEAAREQRYSALRLFTPAGHGRGRRFYEREGWTLSREPFDDERFGMPLVEYRRTL
jgi:GNAT superfamily N-acetyltransferase